MTHLQPNLIGYFMIFVPAVSLFLWLLYDILYGVLREYIGRKAIVGVLFIFAWIAIAVRLMNLN